ncbi:teneurin-3, partial [Arapaima gigas]
MHLLGLNWQLQEAEHYAFENGQTKSDAAPTNAVTALTVDG